MIPRDRTPDATLALLREGYAFIGNRCRRLGTDAFETRVLLEPLVCIQGAEGAELLYSERFTRKRALPLPVLTLLQDLGSVQGLDGEAHRHRKAMFLELMAPEARERLCELAEREWTAAIERWARADRVVLLDEAHEVLCRAVCAWAGVPLSEEEVARRTAEFAAMVDGAGSAGPRNVRGHLARRRTERWIAGLIRKIRVGELEPPEGSAARVIAFHRDLRGELLPEEVATVELINVLRPTVAVSRFVVFAALALHEHPGAHEHAGGDGFVHEVRRYYPFFPSVAGRVKEPFEWRGERFHVGRWAMLDVYGTNRDPRIWERPDAFEPQRFDGWDGDPYTFVPQGAGDHATTHRCPGEWTTIDLMRVAVRALTERAVYAVPPQDLRIRLSRMPAQPESGLVLADVRAA